MISGSRTAGANILLKEVTDAERFGVAEISGDRIVGIEEKPRHPKSNYAVTGIYMYDATVFDKIRTLVPSEPRRTGNHRRQQRLHPRRLHDVSISWMAGGPMPAPSIRCCAPPTWWRNR